MKSCYKYKKCQFIIKQKQQQIITDFRRMRENWKKEDLIGKLPVLIFAAAILSITGVSLIREYGTDYFLCEREINKEDAIKWMEAVKRGDERRSILLAEKLVSDDMPVLPDSDYLRLMTEMHLSSLILTEPFNKFDYLRWKDAFELKSIIDTQIDTTQNCKSPLLKIFDAVMTKVTYRDSNKDASPPLLSSDIWNRGYGDSSEICRLLCGLVWQAGYSVQIVSFFDVSGNPVHRLCEFRKDNEVAVADPRFNKIWHGFSIKYLMGNPIRRGESDIWPESLITSIKHRLYELPAEFQDYRVLNQKLVVQLEKFDIKDMPRFGEDPRKRIESYIKYFPEGNISNIITYWRYPFLLISEDYRLEVEF